MTLTNNLYPPIVYDTMPAFIKNQSCNIYFSLSKYNSYEDIKFVQLSIIEQKTNASALNSSYLSGIKLYNIQIDSTVKNEYKYYITIDPSDLREKEFQSNTFYKIQLRFVSVNAGLLEYVGQDPLDQTKGDQTNPTARWLFNNKQHFSEWSKVCLIKPISKPQVILNLFEDYEKNQSVFTLGEVLTEVVGQLYFEDNEQEYLKSYRIQLFDNDSYELVVDSGEIYANEYQQNEIHYELPYLPIEGRFYILTLTYTTNNDYSASNKYQFLTVSQEEEEINAIITVSPENDFGRMKIMIASNNTSSLKNVTIRRSSSKSQFHKWEDVFTIPLSNHDSLYTWYDYTVQSGVWYRYGIQQRNGLGGRGVLVPKSQNNNPPGTKAEMCVFDDIFLTTKNAQLKIQFNPVLTDFKYNVTESRQIGIGAKYPFVKRNSNNYFRTFQIGGLISSFVDRTDWYDPHFDDGTTNNYHHINETGFSSNNDEVKLFTSKQQIYGNSKNLYDNYNQENNVNSYNDYIYEKEFRQKVYDFLYQHNVKLFKSTTQGNILVKLMNISFQPNQSLGRMLYSFTATAVQIDEVTVLNCDKYNIQKIGNYESNVINEIIKFGQLQGKFGINNEDIVQNILNNKYKNKAIKGFKNLIRDITYFKLEIYSSPTVINDSISGYVIYINNIKTIIPAFQYFINGQINRMGYFEFNATDIPINSLKFERPLDISMDYLATIEEKEDTSKIVRTRTYYYNPGQLFGSFYPGEKLITKIYKRQFADNNEFYKKLQAVHGIQIQGPPGTVVYIKDSKDQDYNRHILENGYLQLIDDNATINELYFYGIHLPTEINVNDIKYSKRKINSQNPNENLLPSDGTIYNDFPTQNLIDGKIYQIKMKKVTNYAVLNNEWFDNDNLTLLMENNYPISSYEKDGQIYSLFLDPVYQEEVVDMVYYYGEWYSLNFLQQNAQEFDAAADNVFYNARPHEWINMGTVSSLDDITNPINHGVYTYEASGTRYIYYNERLCVFTDSNDVICPIDGIVDYYYEAVKGVYKNES